MKEEYKIAIITGAGSGIGRDAALYLAQRGYCVYATMRREEHIHTLKAEAQEQGLGNLHVLPLDVTDERQIDDVRDQIYGEQEQRFVSGSQPLLCLINNAGYGVVGASEELLLADYRNQMETNFFGAIAVSKAFLPVMRESQKGRIIQISSGFGRVGAPLMSAYNASKFALEGFSEALRYEMLPHNVFISLVEPGPVSTEFNRKITYDRPANSPYNDLYKRADVAASAGERVASTARDVTKIIEKICEARYPSLRYEVGIGGYLAKISSQFAPQDLVEGIYRFL